MERILVFCARDWLHPKAGRTEHYVHKVFAWIAAQGHHVVWVSHQFRLLASRKRRPPQVEVVDGIQIARLGARSLYGIMSGMFLSRVHKSDKEGRILSFNAVVDCITSHPLPLAHRTEAPIIPLVFNLSAKLRADEQPPGPIIAATDKAWSQLVEAGAPPNSIIRALYGVDASIYTPGGERSPTPTLVSTSASLGCLRTAVSLLEAGGLSISVDTPGVKRTWRNRLSRAVPPIVDPIEIRERYRRGWVGCCGAGTEHEALAMAACGLPVVCAATDAGKEYVEQDRTGLLYSPGSARELADCVRRLMKDPALRNRMALEARARAEARSWERTASLVLAAIENLPKPDPEIPKRSPATLVRK